MFKNSSAFATEAKQEPVAAGADAAMRDEDQEMQIDTTERAQKEPTAKRQEHKRVSGQAKTNQMQEFFTKTRPSLVRPGMAKTNAGHQQHTSSDLQP